MTDFLGGGLVFAIAAALWLVYLVPSWIRRRNFVATEQNALRLQQTIRVLVETGDAPDEIRAEISARGVHEQRKALRAAEADARNNLRAHAAPAPSPEETDAIARHRRRTQRLIAFVAFIVSLLAVAAGLALVAYTATWTLVWAGATATLISLVALRLLARPARSKASPAATRREQGFTDFAYAPEAATRAWTPRPLPRPLHLEPGSLAQATVASVSAADRLRQAAQEEALRDRMERATGVNPVRQAETTEATSVPVQNRSASPALSSLDALAQVENQADQTQAFNLDEVFRRRASA